MADRGVAICSFYTSLFGITTATALASWSVSGYPNSASTVLLVGCTLLAGFAVLALDQLSKQTRGLPNTTAALAMAGTMVGIQIALGVPLSQLMLYVLGGFFIGGLTGAVGKVTRAPALLMPLAALGGAVLASLQAWNSLQVTPVTMWQMVFIIVVPALALSSLAPTIDMAVAGRVCALALLLAGMWFWPVMALAYGSGGWRISTWVWVLEGVGMVSFLVSTSTSVQILLDRLWVVADIERRLFVRQLEQILKQFSPDQLLAFQRTYANVDPMWRASLLKSMISVDTLDGWARVVEHQEIPFGRDALEALTETARTSPSSLRELLLRLLYEGVQHERYQVWQPYLDKLIQLDQNTALSACQRRLDTDDLDPICHFLSVADLSGYSTGLLTLAGYATQTPGNAREKIVSFIQREAHDRPPDQAAIAFVALASLNLDVLPRVYARRQQDRIAVSLLKLGERNAELRHRIIAVFREALQIDVSDEVAQRIADGQLDLRDWLFPFVMRPEEEERELHLEELVNEPDDCVTASYVTAWIYKPQGQIMHIVLAGHANVPVCKQISAKLFGTFLEYGDDGANEALLVPGAFLMQAPPSAGKQSITPLDDLVQQLRQVQELTGMVQLRDVGPISYDEVCATLREHIEQGIRSGRPVLLCRSNPDAPSRAVFVPFYALNGEQLIPLHFDLDYKLFSGPEFDYLLRAHRLELRHEMVADALNRKRIYEEWRERDVRDIYRHTYALFQRVLPATAVRDLESLTESYIQVLLNELPETLPIWTPGLPLQVRNLLAVERSQRLRQFIDSNRPGVISSDAEWTRLIETVLVKEFPIQGQRNYIEATITDSGRRLAYVGLQELVEWNIPSLIRSDNEWIGRMDELLRKFDEADPKREARTDAINLGTFLDAFLRGWASVFLPDEETKARYKCWCAERREAVWRVTHQSLTERGMRMDPLQVDNVVFAVRKVGKHRVRVTPYYLTSDRAFIVLLHPRFGMTYYVNAWQHRQRVAASVESAQDNRAICMVACQSGEKALAAGDSDAALKYFKQALRAHPAAAAERISTRSWATTSQDAHSQLDDLMSLVEAVNLFPRDPDQACQKLNRFVECYPDFLPDPYLLLGYHNHELATEVSQIESRLHALQDRTNELIEALVENGVLIPVYLDGRHGERSGKFTINMRVADRQDRQRVDELNRLQEEIAQTGRELVEARRQAWYSLQARPNERLAHAMALDAEYVTRVLHEAMLMASPGYARHIAPLYGLLKGNEYLRIERELREKIQTEKGDLIDQLRDRAPNRQRATLKRLRSIVDECTKTKHLESQETSALRDLRRLLDQFEQVDSITRERAIRDRTRDIGADYVRRAYHLYNEAASRVPEITEVRKQFSSCQYMMCHYRHALRTLIGGPTIPVQNGFAQAQFDVLISTPLQVGSVALDSASKTIQVISPQGQSHSVLRFSGLSADECQHLTAEFAKPECVPRLEASRLTPAYGILLTPISVPPQTKLWQDVLLSLEAWLIRVLAYTGISPTGVSLEGEIVLSHFDHTPVVEQVIVDPIAIRERFLGSVDLDRKVIVQDI